MQLVTGRQAAAGACASSSRALRRDHRHPANLYMNKFLSIASHDYCTPPSPSLGFPPASITRHPDTEPKNSTEYFCRYFCTQSPCLLSSTRVHGNNLHLPLLWGIHLVSLQFMFFTAARPISVFLKTKFQIKKTLPCSRERVQLKWLSSVQNKMNYCSDLLNGIKRQSSKQTWLPKSKYKCWNIHIPIKLEAVSVSEQTLKKGNCAKIISQLWDTNKAMRSFPECYVHMVSNAVLLC